MKEKENGTLKGVIVQFGGQTPLKLAHGLEQAGIPILGTSVDSIDLAEDRDRFKRLLDKLGLKQPMNGIAYSVEQGRLIAADLGLPLVVRPSYVLGGRAMAIIHDQAAFDDYLLGTLPGLVPSDVKARYPNDKTGQINTVLGKNPLLFDRYLSDATEVDVDCLCDGKDVFVAGIMEHIEEAGIHSGDSACSLPPYSLSKETIDEMKRQTAAMARGLKVVGLMNVQFAIQEKDGKDVIFVLEVNPRASRTVPYVSKATGIQLAKVAARCMVGQSLASQGITREVTPPYFSVKEAVFPFVKFPGVDTILGPEMKSTGEVMGVGKTFGEAFIKSQIGAGTKLPRPTDAVKKVFLTVKNNDKARAVEVARQLAAVGFDLVATKGTAAAITAAGIPCVMVNKVTEGRPHVVDMIKNNEIALVINTVEERRNAIADSRQIRTSALLARVTTFTTIWGAEAAVEGMKHMDDLGVVSLQELHAQLRAATA
jgi:carbamoyl-phosphate synthase large subunit